MNTQTAEKYSNTELLQVHSIFKTIQGEGPFQGEPAIFIRLTGCNIACPKCDTDYTSQQTEMSPFDIVAKVNELLSDKAQKTLVVITGGEPFRQNLKRLLERLSCHPDVYTQIETNGTLDPPDVKFNSSGSKEGVSIVVSPKTSKIKHCFQMMAIGFKYILNSDHISAEDGLPTSVLGYTHSPARALYTDPEFYNTPKNIFVVPEDSGAVRQNKLNRDAAIESAMRFGYTFQIQLHKHLGLE